MRSFASLRLTYLVAYRPTALPPYRPPAPSTSINLRRCVSPAKLLALPSATSLGKQLVSYSGMYLREGKTGPAVTISAFGSAERIPRRVALSIDTYLRALGLGGA